MDRTCWDAFVATCAEAWLWHLSDFQDVMVDRGLVDLSFAIVDRAAGDAVVALVPLHLRRRKDLRLLRWQTAHSHGGPALADDLGEKQRGKVRAAILAALTELSRSHALTEITFTLAPMAPAYRGERCPTVNPLLQFGCQNTLIALWAVDLRPAAADVRRAYAYQTRHDLKQAEAGSFEIREATGIDDLDAYYRLHEETCRRTGDQPHPWAYYRRIFTACLSKGLCRVVFFCRDGPAVAAQATGIYRGGAYFWFGASSTDKLQHGGENRSLFHDQMMYARSRGCAWYQMGDALITGKLKGISDFKSSFGSVLYPYFKGRLVYRTKTAAFMQHVQLLTGKSE
jgi:hypothetical protein